MAGTILAFLIINYSPFDIGYKLCRTLPVLLITTSFAQLFRSTAVMKFVNVCFEAFKESPSAYYPIPVFGPILYATLLGNMSGLVLKGFNGHFGNGMPWPVQNGTLLLTKQIRPDDGSNVICGLKLCLLLGQRSYVSSSNRHEIHILFLRFTPHRIVLCHILSLLCQRSDRSHRRNAAAHRTHSDSSRVN